MAATILTKTMLTKTMLTSIMTMLSMLVATTAHESTFGLHGSGTTNPSRCYWSIMETLREQTIVPLHTSYRGIGSTNGMMEFAYPFLNQSDFVNDETYPNFFGSGDIPITAEIYQKIIAAVAASSDTPPLVHIPVLAGTVSFFYHVPNLTSTTAEGGPVTNLNLTACLLSQIYTQGVTTWNDPAILEINPTLNPDSADIPIIAIRRSEGSSSTHAATNYMHTACKDSALTLPITLTGELPGWSEPTDSFLSCSGSSGVTKCLVANIGAIGYIDTGHGLDAGLSEVRLQSTYDPNIFFHSQESSNISDAITSDLLPNLATDDFSNVTFLNRGSTTTWPLILMTYIYVRTDLPSLLANPIEQTLLVAFLRTFFNSEYINICSKLYGFTVMNDIPFMKEYGENAIDLVENSINASATKWTFESSTTLYDGAGPYVFSSKRKEIIDVTVQDLSTAVMNIENDLATRVDSDETTIKTIEDLQQEIERIILDIAALESRTSSDTSLKSGEDEAIFTSQDASQIKAALALSSLSFIFWSFWIGSFVWRMMNRSKANATSVESMA